MKPPLSVSTNIRKDDGASTKSSVTKKNPADRKPSFQFSNMMVEPEG